MSLETERFGKRKTQTGPIQRFRCRSCGHIFSLRQTKGKLTDTKKVSLTRTHLEGRTSIRTLQRQTGYAKQTIQSAIHEVTKGCVDSAFIARYLQPQWSGYLAVDGTYIRSYDWSAKHFRHTSGQKRFLHKMVWLVALDLGTLDIVHHHLGDEETMIDLILFYRQIQQNGYPLKGLVSDGNPDIARAARKVFGNQFAHQICIRHYLENLRRAFRQDLIPEATLLSQTKAIRSGKPPPELPKELFSYQTTPLPRTNQQIENLFRQLRLRTRSLNQFHSRQTAEDYLNAWSLCRRFTPFTDCRDRTKNNHSPLQLAGCDTTNLDYLKLKTNLFLGR